MSGYRHIAAILLACALWHGAAAQEEPRSRPFNDAQLWLSLGTEFKPFRKKAGHLGQARFFRNLRATGELEWRLNDNATHLKQLNIDAGLRYPLADFLRAGVQYRYSVRDSFHPNVQRIDLQLWAKWRPGRFKLEHRAEYEHSFTDVRKYRTLLRNKLSATYNIPNWKLDPAVSAEAFTALHYTGTRLVGMRYDIGTELGLGKKKKSTMALTLRYDREMNVKAPKYAWILVAAMEHDFRKK